MVCVYIEKINMENENISTSYVKAFLNHTDLLTMDFVTSELVLITSLLRVTEARSCGNFYEKQICD